MEIHRILQKYLFADEIETFLSSAFVCHEHPGGHAISSFVLHRKNRSFPGLNQATPRIFPSHQVQNDPSSRKRLKGSRGTLQLRTCRPGESASCMRSPGLIAADIVWMGCCPPLYRTRNFTLN